MMIGEHEILKWSWRKFSAQIPRGMVATIHGGEMVWPADPDRRARIQARWDARKERRAIAEASMAGRLAMLRGMLAGDEESASAVERVKMRLDLEEAPNRGQRGRL